MNSKNQIPTIEAEIIILRPFRLNDASEVQRQAGDPLVAKTTATIPHPYHDGMAEDWISKHQEWFEKGLAVDWAIELKKEKKLVGCISLGINKIHQKAELGYWIGPEFWGKGYCSEAAVHAVKYAFEVLGLNKITARHMHENPNSGKIMQKIGMQKEGYLRKDFIKDGRYCDMVVYGLLNQEHD